MSRPDARSWTCFLLPGALLLALLFVIPLILNVVFSFGTTDILGRPVLGTSTANYRLVLQTYNLPVLWRTVVYAGLATAICAVIGFPVAYLAGRFARRVGLLVIALVVLPWLVDYLVRIYAWRELLADQGPVTSLLSDLGIYHVQLVGTAGAVVGGLVYSYLPLMILPIYAAVGELDSAIVEAGKDLYGSPSSTFWHVTLPATRSGLIGGCLLVFLPAIGDFATAQFLGGASSTMIGNLITDQFTSSGSQTFGAALSVALIAVLVIVLAGGWGATSLRRRHTAPRAVVSVGDRVAQ